MSSKRTTRVLLFGLGSIGGFYAFILGQSKDVELSVVARSNYEAVKTDGLSIDSANHGQHSINIDHVLRSPSEASETFDYIVCTHKATDIAAIPALFQGVLNDSTTFVIIQNGVGNEVPFRALYPRNTIISCVTWVGASQQRPGLIKHTSAEDMQIGLYHNSFADPILEAEKLKIFAVLLEEGKTILHIVDDIQRKRWEKVVWNAAWNPLTTLTLVDTKTWLESSEEAYAMTIRLMREMIDIAQRCNVPLTYDLADELMAKVKTMGRIGSSMQQDAKAGRPLEVDVILGHPVRKAREFGMDTPVLDTVFALTTAVHRRIVKTGA
ncbi:hypothetical protein MBLNU13_g04421t2 [Cladosporium sp. NU13]